MQHRMVEVNEA